MRLILMFIGWSLINTLHLGHTKPDMFSMTPIIGKLTFLQNVISLRTSNKLTSCGVVTTTAPVIPDGFKY